jgi:hypothetical protein
MWDAACEYFQWCIDNPWYRNEAIKGGDRAGQIIQIPTSRPFTMQGLCAYLNCNTVYFNNFELGIKDGTRKVSEDEKKGFSEIIHAIKETIYQQKFEGAAVGAYNANIIARDLGLTDKQDIVKTKKIKVTRNKPNDEKD